MRNELGVIMVGVNTITKDNPLLDCRLVKGKDPAILVIDSKLSISPKAKILKNADNVIIACTEKAPKKRVDRKIPAHPSYRETDAAGSNAKAPY